MTNAATTSLGTDSLADEQPLRDFTAHAVERAHAARVDTVTCDPLTSSTSYRTSRINARLVDGRMIVLFVKDFSSSVRPKDAAAERREREMRFYLELAPDGELGTARCYGAVGSEGEAPRWLLLEYLEGVPVRYREFEHWVPAAALLGRMHGHFWLRREQVEAKAFLEHQNAEFFRYIAERSIRAVTGYSAELGVRLSRVTERWDDAITEMLRPPRTLLHGGYHALNVLTSIPGQPDRLCAIDWEEAGVGCALSDLSYFARGFDPARRDRLVDAYYSAAAPYGLPLPPDRDQTVHVMNCFALHKVVQGLPKYVGWIEPWKTIPKLVTYAEELAKAVWP